MAIVSRLMLPRHVLAMDAIVRSFGFLSVAANANNAATTVAKK
jgi:hypothetical protein